MLQDTPVFKSFDLMFLSQLTYALEKEAFTNDEKIFSETDFGSKIYFI
jgi:hypothetical protein